MKLSAMTMLIVLSCVPAHSTAPETPWRVSVTTSGGITGDGTGNVVLTSDGNVIVRTVADKECTFTATEEERTRFATLVGNAHPETWDRSYAPENRCCDRIEYTLTVDEGGVQRTTDWIDDPLPRPKDLVELAEALGELQRKYAQQCL